ncbi:MAG TPA: arginine repressor [Clostridia bacterium]|nr:arginine repressor [Clostridia bacterium]
MKSKRHSLILEIIKSKDIETQEELTAELEKRGINVTQATVSRDIKELRLIKVPTEANRYKYALPEEQVSAAIYEKMSRVIKESVINIDASENIIVIKTLTGSAQGVAAGIDSIKWPEVIGTVAGDDTIFLVIKPKDAVQSVMEKLRLLIV